MICPACKTNNSTNKDAEFCVQCGTDIHLHRLLRVVREEIQMKNEPELAKQPELVKQKEQREQNEQNEQNEQSEPTVKSTVKTEPITNPPKKISSLLLIAQVFPSLLLLFCALFGIFVGIRFLTFIERTESQRSTISAKWSETGFEQLQQMNATIKQELDLILDQRRENLLLQKKISKLTTPRAMPKNSVSTGPLHSFIQEIKQ